MAGRVLLPTAAACLGMASLVAGFLPSAPRVCRTPVSLSSTAVDSGASVEDGGDLRVTWDYGQQHKVHLGDKFVLRPDVKDYAKLNEKEWAALSEESVDLGKQATMGYTTAIPAGHPFAHARVLNVVAKCKSIGATTAFYEGVLGMHLLRETAAKDYLAAVVGYGSEEFGQNIGLQFVQGNPTNMGDGFQGITVVVPDVDAVVAKAEAMGGKVLSPAANYEHAATLIPDQDAQEINHEYRATIADPDGYKVTVMKGDHKDKLAYVTLRVFDAEKAVEFYGKMGMKLLRKRANLPVETSMSWCVGYDDDHVFSMGFVHEKLPTPQFHVFHTPKTMIELKYEYDSKEVKVGDGLVGVTVGVFNGVPGALAHAKSGGAKVLQELGSSSGGEGLTDVATVADVDGYPVTLVDMEQFNKLLV